MFASLAFMPFPISVWHERNLNHQTLLWQVALLNGSKYRSPYLDTIKRVCDFGRIFHFEEGAQVSSSVEKLNLKSFVSKSNLTAEFQIKDIMFKNLRQCINYVPELEDQCSLLRWPFIWPQL